MCLVVKWILVIDGIDLLRNVKLKLIFRFRAKSS